MFSHFEMSAHKAVGKGRVTGPEFSALYQSELKKMFGNAVSYTDEYNWEWSSIPHFIDVPFYVYAYNFGNLLVMALYQQYLEEGAHFVPKFKQFLSMGSIASPKEITGLVNANISSPTFWKKSILYIESLLKQLDELVND